MCNETIYSTYSKSNRNDKYLCLMKRLVRMPVPALGRGHCTDSEGMQNHSHKSREKKKKVFCLSSKSLFAKSRRQINMLNLVFCQKPPNSTTQDQFKNKQKAPPQPTAQAQSVAPLIPISASVLLYNTGLS